MLRVIQGIGPDKRYSSAKLGIDVTLAHVLIAQGQLTAAAILCNAVLASVGDDGDVYPNAASLALAQLGVIAHHQNQPEQAEQYLRRAIALVEQWQIENSESYATTFLAWALREQGNGQAALQLIERAQALRRDHNLFVERGLAGMRVHVWLNHGDLSRADEWATQFDAAA